VKSWVKCFEVLDREFAKVRCGVKGCGEASIDHSISTIVQVELVLDG